MYKKQINAETPSCFTLRCTFHSKASINHIAWSPNGGFLISLSNNGMLQIWDTKRGNIFHTLTVSAGSVNCVAWSPDGSKLAFSSEDEEIRLWVWDFQTKEYLTKFDASTRGVSCISWSSDRELLAVGTFERNIQIWNIKTGNILHTLIGHSDMINQVVWSPDGHVLASCSDDKTIRIWNPQTGKVLRTLIGHSRAVRSIVWSLRGGMFISSDDQVIRIWDSNSGREIRVLEGIAREITSISLSSYDRLLASKSYDGTIHIWRTDTWQVLETLDENFSNYYWPPILAFHPKAPVIASIGKADTINIWDIDIPTLLASSADIPNIYYTNAKVVLVGDSGVGKSGLGLVLSRKSFIPTESTHGRYIWNLDNQEIEHNDGTREMREILLWDLAGQPGYRLIHQLHLNEVAVVLIVFDSHNELDPFAGVKHWSRALRTAERVSGKTTSAMKKILVAARVDRGGKRVSSERIEALLEDLGFDGYIETSAKESYNISELRENIKDAIYWEMLPKVTSTDHFRRIKAFLVVQKGIMRVLSTIEDLYQIYLTSKNIADETTNFKSIFETCVILLESQGLIKRLGFGNLVLLQPELLDTYASALVNAVRDEPDGLGNILEEKVRAGQFFIPKDERIADLEQEKLLLIAMIEDLLYHEIILREYGDDGLYLVFPSQSTRENVDLPNPEGRAVIFAFEGPVQNVYVTLAVRLSHSGFFKKKALWRNAITYTTTLNGTCGILLRNIDEGRAELTLFFDDRATEEAQFHFEEYVRTHLVRKAIPETIERWRIFVCPGCKTPLGNLQVTRRRERGFPWIICGVCETRVSLLDHKERLESVPSSIVAEMDHIADVRVERETAKSRLQGKIEMRDFDVFLCHNGKDNAMIQEIGQKLKDKGILPWLDWELRPGSPWQRLLEQQIEQIKSAVVFVGRDGIGPWQYEVLEAFLLEFIKRDCPVIPVLLPDAPQEPRLPPFLRNRTWVDFRQPAPNPMELLIWGITGKRKLI